MSRLTPSDLYEHVVYPRPWTGTTQKYDMSEPALAWLPRVMSAIWKYALLLESQGQLYFGATHERISDRISSLRYEE
jgi:hypothetical protein